MEGISEHDRSDEFVAFQGTGARVKGQYGCAECGYGIMVHDELPVCPMCAGTSWEPVLWTPFGHALDLEREHGATR